VQALKKAKDSLVMVRCNADAIIANGNAPMAFQNELMRFCVLSSSAFRGIPRTA
jgi:hypothetical protein